MSYYRTYDRSWFTDFEVNENFFRKQDKSVREQLLKSVANVCRNSSYTSWGCLDAVRRLAYRTAATYGLTIRDPGELFCPKEGTMYFVELRESKTSPYPDIIVMGCDGTARHRPTAREKEEQCAKLST